ncbi:hypothetical protein ColLi_05442 [Colletotrichum liriopes]|uniref:Uncharacterized protein n=1 Tax=Colletotrichum liriopes TaxID=708192 RepID=A0AA37GKB0_9PEZI|nr:hypothetical protein ColLi_05442 [Colletotrichum liriopes]
MTQALLISSRHTAETSGSRLPEVRQEKKKKNFKRAARSLLPGEDNEKKKKKEEDSDLDRV